MPSLAWHLRRLSFSLGPQDQSCMCLWRSINMQRNYLPNETCNRCKISRCLLSITYSWARWDRIGVILYVLAKFQQGFKRWSNGPSVLLYSHFPWYVPEGSMEGTKTSSCTSLYNTTLWGHICFWFQLVISLYPEAWGINSSCFITFCWPNIPPQVSRRRCHSSLLFLRKAVM